MRAVLLSALALAGCAVASQPPPRPAVQAAPLDWFQQQVADARRARQTHMPKDDRAGAQADYDQALHAACARVALSGPEKYQQRCAALLRRAQPAVADPPSCDEAFDDPATLKACND